MRIWVLAVAALCSQGQSEAPAFDAASVKPNHSGSGSSSSHTRESNIQITNVPLLSILAMAYELKEYQIEGPPWIRTERYDIVAKAPVGTKERAMAPMMQALLRERFKMETHRETKDFPVYGLVAIKGKFTLEKVDPKNGSSMNSNSDEHGGQLTATRTTMARMAEWMSHQVDRPVIDMTGIEGAFDFTLKFTTEREQQDPGNTVKYAVVPLAIQDQLGLRLEKRVAPIEMLVVDRAEKVPVEN